MARKTVVNYTLATNQSLSGSFNTPATVITNLDSCSYQINVNTTNSTGTFAVQVSNDYQQDEVSNIIKNPGNWVPLTLSGTPVVAGANDNIVIDLQAMPYYAMRLAYTASTPGTGTCSIIVECKQLGG